MRQLTIDGIVTTEVEIRESLARSFLNTGRSVEEARELANEVTEIIFSLWADDEE